MAKINWKVAALGGAAVGAAVGGFTLASADTNDTPPVRDVDLQSYNDSIHSASSPVTVTTEAPTTTVAPAPAPSNGDTTGTAQTADSPVAVVAPAPAPAAPAP